MFLELEVKKMKQASLKQIEYILTLQDCNHPIGKKYSFTELEKFDVFTASELIQQYHEKRDNFLKESAKVGKGGNLWGTQLKLC